MPDERKKLVPIPGVVLKFRTEMRGDRMFATATICLDGQPMREIASLDLMLIEHSGDPCYQGWADCVNRAFNAYLARKTGIESIQTKRRKPNYKGEHR